MQVNSTANKRLFLSMGGEQKSNSLQYPFLHKKFTVQIEQLTNRTMTDQLQANGKFSVS